MIFTFRVKSSATRVGIEPGNAIPYNFSRHGSVPFFHSHARQVILGLVQMTCSDRPSANLDKAIAAIQGAARQGAQIICLQELFGSRYFCQSEDVERFALAEPIPGPTTERLRQLAAAHQVVLIVPCV